MTTMLLASPILPVFKLFFKSLDVAQSEIHLKLESIYTLAHIDQASTE